MVSQREPETNGLMHVIIFPSVPVINAEISLLRLELLTARTKNVSDQVTVPVLTFLLLETISSLLGDLAIVEQRKGVVQPWQPQWWLVQLHYILEKTRISLLMKLKSC